MYNIYNYILISVNGPTNGHNKKIPEKTDRFWEKLELEISKIPNDDVKILFGDFNSQLEKERKYRKNSRFPRAKIHKQNGTRLIDLGRLFNLKIMSASLMKKTRKQETLRSPIHQFRDFQIDHLTVSYDFQKKVLARCAS